MGKPFISELKQLPGTLNWVFNTTPSLSLDWIARTMPAYCIGSGGSQSAADLLARLIRDQGGFAWATTPMEYLSLSTLTSHQGVFMLSAGGRNKDILSVADKAISAESAGVYALTARLPSPLAEKVDRYCFGASLELPVPAGKDGFLATNSLVAMMMTLIRFATPNINQQNRERVLETANSVGIAATPYSEMVPGSEIIILYGGWAGPAAVDLESKLSEAALAPSMLCDLRSFGHGRHHWLAKRGERSMVVALSDTLHLPLLEKTLSLLPPEVPVLRLLTECDGPMAAVDLVLQVFGLVNQIGQAVGIDPGRPGVPDFGHKLYHLSPVTTRKRTTSPAAVSSMRRSGELPSDVTGVRDSYTLEARDFTGRLSGVSIDAIVFDYDGTLVNTSERSNPLRPEIVQELEKLLESGIKVGIATGRGKSVRQPLRDAVSVDFWPSVVVGYYSGSQIIRLDDESLPDNSEPESEDLVGICRFLAGDPWIAREATVELRRHQVTITGGHLWWSYLSRQSRALI